MLKELRARLDKREISVSELCGEYEKRIKKHDGKINSYITLCDAAEDIQNAQKAIDEKSSLPLTGIPLAIKDNICTKGVKTTCASKMLADYVPFYDAHVVSLLKKNGAVILGKTNMDEFGMGSRGENSYFGKVLNPICENYPPGGSSAGSAAAVAARLCPAALGSDTGGSVRLPAAFCGVTGLNPTYGRISRYGLIAFASSLDRVGIIADCAEDAEYVLDVIGDKDEKDATQASGGGFPKEKRARIGVSEELLRSADEEVQRACSAAIDFYKKNGFELTEVSLPSAKYAVSAYYIISSAEAASNLARFDGIRFGYSGSRGESFADLLESARSEGFGKEVKKRIMFGNYVLSADGCEEYYKKATGVRSRLTIEFEEVFKECEIFLSPAAPSGADKPCTSTADIYNGDIFNVATSLAGLPTVTVPCGYTENGMPIGLSLTGKPFCEKTILAAADLFEKSFKRREVRL